MELVHSILQSFTSSLSKVDTSLRWTVGAGPECVHLRGSWLYTDKNPSPDSLNQQITNSYLVPVSLRTPNCIVMLQNKQRYMQSFVCFDFFPASISHLLVCNTTLYFENKLIERPLEQRKHTWEYLVGSMVLMFPLVDHKGPVQSFYSDEGLMLEKSAQ